MRFVCRVLLTIDSNRLDNLVMTTPIPAHVIVYIAVASDGADARRQANDRYRNQSEGKQAPIDYRGTRRCPHDGKAEALLDVARIERRRSPRSTRGSSRT